ncbi:hypothetical protein [Nocardioides pantholopis]|uniref:hypothetical protein n=1 Tax=Nocardioides pantholopis TaxID=2483798 RepID=UPI000FD70FA4|nr:hypothetical protein [Nocardioides pantholopis]
MTLISDESRRLLDPVGTQATSTAELDLLRREVNSPRRLLAGTGAVVLGLIGVLPAGFTASEAAEGRWSGAALAALLTLVVVVHAAWLGFRVVTAGRRVVDGYVARSRHAAYARPGGLVALSLSGPMILRSALAAAGIIGACFAGSLLYLGLSDPDTGAEGAVMGLVLLVVSAVPTWCLVSGEVRVVRAQGQRTRP